MRTTKGSDSREGVREGEFEGERERKPLLSTECLERNIIWGGRGGIKMVFKFLSFIFESR